MRKWTIRLAVVAAIVGLVWALRATFFAPEPLEVETHTVAVGRVEETVTNSRAGTIMARRRAKLSAETGGRVVDIPHREGERVEAGDVLLRLDPGIQEAQTGLARRDLQAAEAERQRACAAAERAERERARLARLAREGIVSADLLDSAETAVRTSAAGCRAAAAGVERARASVSLAEVQGRQTVLRAPFSGVVADLAVEVGEWTTPSPPAVPVPPVVEIIDPGSIYVSAPMDEVDSARIRPGLPARVTIDSHPGRTFAGTVVRVAPYVLDIEAQNRTVEIEVELAGEALSEALLPGTSADVEIVLQVKEGVTRIPTSALLEGNRTLVVGGDGVLVEREVEAGLKNWDWTEVTGGLAAGDRIVVALDRPEVAAGARVEAVESAARRSE